MNFAEYTRTYAKGAGLLLASAAVSYFLTFHSTLSPPLKPRQAIYAMSVLVEAYGILVGLSAPSARKAPLNLMIGAIVLYLVSLFSLTFLIPTSESSYREAIGFICKKEFILLYGSTCYWITPEVLANASFEPDRIWEYWSVQLVRLYLSGVWLLLVWSVVICIALSIRRTDFLKKRTATRPRNSSKGNGLEGR
jgi:hypothetical protein